MNGLLGQEITEGCFVACIRVGRGSCSSNISLVVGLTQSSARIYDKRVLLSMIENDEVRKPQLKTRTRLIVLSDETARNVLGDDYEKINEFRQTLL